MKLIDKEQILYMIDTTNRVIALKNEIDDIPIIEAIPIEWLKKKISDAYSNFDLDIIAVLGLVNILNDWRKEND